MLCTTPLHQLGVATLLFFIICLKEKKTSKLCSFCVCSFSCYPREIFLTCFYRVISFFLKLLKTFKIFYSAAKHFSLSFFLGFTFFVEFNTRFFCLKSHGLFVTSLSYKLESLLFILNCLQISERSTLVTTSLQASFHFIHFVR